MSPVGGYQLTMADKQQPDPGGLFTGVEDAEGDLGDRIDIANLIRFELPKRPRGILSHTDREYLLGQTEYKHAQTEANRKQRIRERIVHAFQDYLLLRLLLDDDERDKVFKDDIDEDLLHDSLEAMVTFVYLGLDQDVKQFEKIIENGVHVGANFDRSGSWVGEATNVDVAIDVEYNPDVERLYQKFREGEGDQLTPAEVGVLVRSGKLEPEDLDALEDTGPTFPGVNPALREQDKGSDDDETE